MKKYIGIAILLLSAFTAFAQSKGGKIKINDLIVAPIPFRDSLGQPFDSSTHIKVAVYFIVSNPDSIKSVSYRFKKKNQKNVVDEDLDVKEKEGKNHIARGKADFEIQDDIVYMTFVIRREDYNDLKDIEIFVKDKK